MIKRMLINATQKEEIRVAIVSGKSLFDLDIERTGRIQKKASIYKGRVTRVEPSLEAAFIDYGAERHGFLPIKEVARECFNQPYEGGRPHIKDILKPGQEILVQIDKEERGNKGAALTTYIGLAGCYLVLMPNNPRAGGISRRIDGEERDEIRDVLNQLPLPEGMGLIVRTAGVGRSIEELRWDLDVLLNQWNAVQQVAQERAAPFLIHRESDVIIRAIRDYLRPDITEILVDTEAAYQHALHHVQIIRPDYADRLKRYDDAIPLFNRFQIESQIESGFKREIELENGASIVIDHTEALIAIDINSARATEGSDIEETAFQTNMAAAKEIARQLRLRDIGGLIVIDFIDMSAPKHQRLVENQLREELSADRARIQIGKISRFGLMEMSRQRLRPSLGDFSHVTCPRCEGQGSVRTIQSLALSILRIVEDEAMKENTAQVHVQAPIDLATFLVNEKRQAISDLENRHHIKIVLISNPHMVTPQYEINRIREDDEAINHRAQPSYSFITTPKPESDEKLLATKEEKADEPAIKQYNASMPAPVAQRDKGLIQRLWKAVFGQSDETATERRENKSQPTQHRHRDDRGYQGNRQGRRPHRHHDRRNEGGRGRDDRSRNERPAGDRSQQDRTYQDRAPQDRAPQDRAPQDRAPQDRAPQDRAPQDRQQGDRAQQDRGRRQHSRGRRGQQRRDTRRDYNYENQTDEGNFTPRQESQLQNNPTAEPIQSAFTPRPAEARRDEQRSAPFSQPVASHSSGVTQPIESRSSSEFAAPRAPAPMPVIQAPKPSAPPEKTAAEKQAEQAARKAQNAISFMKLSEQEKQATMVTMTESSTVSSMSQSHHLKQVNTKREAVKPVTQSAPPVMHIGATAMRTERKDHREETEQESSDSSTKS